MQTSKDEKKRKKEEDTYALSRINKNEHINNDVCSIEPVSI